MDPAAVRIEQLEEALQVIKRLWGINVARMMISPDRLVVRSLSMKPELPAAGESLPFRVLTDIPGA